MSNTFTIINKPKQSVKTQLPLLSVYIHASPWSATGLIANLLLQISDSQKASVLRLKWFPVPQKPPWACLNRDWAIIKNRRRQNALKWFRKAFDLNPDDRVAKRFQKMWKRYFAQSSPEDWNGVFHI